MKYISYLKIIGITLILSIFSSANAQINTDQVMNIGRNALYFEDYILSIQYFNQVIKVKPYMAEPYFFRAIAKLELEDYRGAEEDCTLAIERNPFIIDAYQVRGIARQSLGKDKEAITDYDEGIKQMPEHKILLLNKAVAQTDIKDYDSALKSYNTLIDIYPNFEKAYLGRAQLYLVSGDTINAISDVDKSINLDKNNANAFALRAHINIQRNKDFKSALTDMDEAIKLQPHYEGYFINRAFLKYHQDDYFGAMADYDYAIALDPMNITAHFNRGLMLAEVSDNDRAIKDFTFVIGQDPNNVIARYNRAELYAKAGLYRKAITDYDVVVDKYPTFEGAYYARSECKRKSGDMAGGERDYNRYRDLSKQNNKFAEYDEKKANVEPTHEEEQEQVKGRFKNLLTIENDSPVKAEYENKTRGKVQDNNVKIDPENSFMLSFYDVKDDVRNDVRFTRELTEINDAHLLSFTLVLSNSAPRLNADGIQKHFNSIDYYTSLISAKSPRSIDYFARAIDYMMVKNPASAIADLDKAIELSPKFILAYFARANARYNMIQSEEIARELNADKPMAMDKTDAMLNERKKMQSLTQIITDLNTVTELSPKMVYAYYNKGNAMFQMQDLTSALSAYSKAIEIKPDFGEAYYNRGLVYLQLGNKEMGTADLSKAGELGITPSYSVLKRMMK